MIKARRMYLRLLASTAVLALIAGIQSGARADVYAFAQQQLTNFTFTGATAGAFTFGTSSSAIQAGVPSGMDAHLGGTGLPSDVLESYVGPPPKPPENLFTQVGQVNADYVRGDALINTARDTNNVGEGFLAHAGNSAGVGAWSASAPITVTAAGGSTVTLSFDFSNLLKVIIDTNHGLGNQSATAVYEFNFTIQNATGIVVFNSKPSDVNKGIGLTAPGSIGAPPSGLPATGSVIVTSILLPAGTYQATLTGSERVFLSASGAVPEPGSLVLLCMGGVAFAAMYRVRRSKVSL
jgi:hypothetical protein